MCIRDRFAAVQATGAGLRRDFIEVENLQQSLRGAADFVSKAAKRIEESVISDLELVRPFAGILTPNISQTGNGRDEFVLALSGAKNFVRGIPQFAISLALVTNGETKISMIYSPIDDKLYYAEAGNGAFIFSSYHSTRIGVSQLKNPKDLIIGLGSSESISDSSNYRVSGCPAMDLAYVASGKYDKFVSELLDYAEICAGQMIVTEAGGQISEQDGKLVASNKLI